MVRAAWGWVQSVWYGENKERELPYVSLLPETKWKKITIEAVRARRREMVHISMVAGLATAVHTRMTTATTAEIAVTAALIMCSAGADKADTHLLALPCCLAHLKPQWDDFLTTSLKNSLSYTDRVTCLTSSISFTETRLQAYFNNTLIPYEYPRDTNTDMAMRVADGAAFVASTVAPHFERWGTALSLVGQVGNLRKIAPYMLGSMVLSSEMGEAIADLVSLMSCDEFGDCKTSASEIAIGLYYYLTYRRGERGNNTLTALSEHSPSSPGVVSDDIPEDLYARLTHYAPFAKFVYGETPADTQRLCLQFGFTLIHHEPIAPARHPSYCILGNKTQAIVVLRGTKNISDILIDICTVPETFTLPNSKKVYQVHRGMLRSAVWLYHKLYLPLFEIKRRGLEIVIVGHSLGAGVGVMLTAMLRDSGLLPDLKCVGFAMPACVDKNFATDAEEYTLSGIHGDDLVPRVRSTSLRNLMTAISDPVFRNRSEKDYSGDRSALITRIASVWAPRVRPNLSARAKSPIGSLFEALDASNYPYVECLKQAHSMNNVTVRLMHVSGMMTTITVNEMTSLPAFKARCAKEVYRPVEDLVFFLQSRNGGMTLLSEGFLEGLSWAMVVAVEDTVRDTNKDALAILFSNPGEEPEGVGVLHLDFKTARVKEVAAAIAAMTGRTDFRTIDLWKVVGQKETGMRDHCQWTRTLHEAGFASGGVIMARDAWGARLGKRAGAPKPGSTKAAMVEFYPAGVLVHTYYCCGVAMGSVLRPWARALEKIELSSKIGDDHRMDAIIRGLRSVATTTKFGIKPTAWEPFSSVTSCRCCTAHFSWSSTSTTAASALRSQCHCHHCGNVVCTECRTRTLALPGYPCPSPICDTCFFKI
eukprot:TRINITY_DN194_c3_g1_i1.p1 TRINITY_DN194_c3_g1~~TRINITY_DN194_c3_g1_i1.p1  ORF type:complete len:893 (+),score=156.96 TRINITY_DN194_c3_g1_i1:58-2679(+)